MVAADMKRFSGVMAYLSLHFPEREVSDNLIDLYFSELAEFAFDDIAKAARAYVRTGDRFPYVADFIRILSTESAGVGMAETANR